MRLRHSRPRIETPPRESRARYTHQTVDIRVRALATGLRGPLFGGRNVSPEPGLRRQVVVPTNIGVGVHQRSLPRQGGICR